MTEESSDQRTPDGLDGRAAVVTGALGGMGRSIVRHLADAGVDVVASDVAVLPDDAGDLWSGTRGAIRYRRADVSDPGDMAAIAELAVGEFGRLDIGVNAAAIEFEIVPLADCADDDFDRMMSVNVRGVFLAMKHQLRAMLAGGNGGAIVNIASTNSFTPQPDQPAYTASKHAVLGLTRSAALDDARHGIRVNAICPGAIDTPMLRTAIDRRGRDPRDVAGRLSRLGRFGDPDEIARAALWLVSDASSFTTGHALAVDGGMLGT